MSNTTISYNDTWQFEAPVNFNTVNIDGLSGNDGILLLNGQNIGWSISSLSSNFTSLSILSAGFDNLSTSLDQALLSGASFAGGLTTVNLSVNGPTTLDATVSTLKVGTHFGYTHNKQVVFMDSDGNSFMVYLRNGIFTTD